MLVLALAVLQSGLSAQRLADARCRAAPHAVIVKVSGFANRAGQVRVRLFGDSPSTYFDKKQALVRIQIPVPAAGPVEFCVTAPRAGVYAVDVRHDVNGTGKTDRQDGGGASGNPRLSLFDVLLSRKPRPASVQFTVGNATTIVPVTLMYLRGTSFRPVKDTN